MTLSLAFPQVYIAAFAVSAYSSTYHRAGCKPFNPVLGETYECERPDRGFRFISEQVWAPRWEDCFQGWAGGVCVCGGEAWAVGTRRWVSGVSAWGRRRSRWPRPRDMLMEESSALLMGDRSHEVLKATPQGVLGGGGTGVGGELC